jgi:hypothetical protein
LAKACRERNRRNSLSDDPGRGERCAAADVEQGGCQLLDGCLELLIEGVDLVGKPLTVLDQLAGEPG